MKYAKGQKVQALDVVGRKSVSIDPVARAKQTGLAGKKAVFLKRVRLPSSSRSLTARDN